MPSLALALLALAPPTDSGVWLDAPPKPGTVVTRPVEIAGETQAVEGVRRVELYVVRGAQVTLVDAYEPPLPLGTIPFELTWDPKGAAPGRVTIRVVATTLLRGFSAEATGLVVPRAQAAAKPVARPAARPAAYRPPAARPVAPAPRAPRLDDSGRAFGAHRPTLPYVRYYDNVPLTPPAPPAAVAAPVALPVDQSAWGSVAGGLLLLLACSHLHLVLQAQPDPRDGR